MNWLGSFFVVFAGYMLGLRLASEEKKKLTALDSLLALLNYMRRRVTDLRMPLSDIFLRFEDDYLELTGFLPRVRSGIGSIKERWSAALTLLPLEKETEAELALFGEELGRLSLAEQEKRIDVCILALASEREKLKDKLPAKQKSVKTVCLLASALTAIILF